MTILVKKQHKFSSKVAFGPFCPDKVKYGSNNKSGSVSFLPIIGPYDHIKKSEKTDKCFL